MAVSKRFSRLMRILGILALLFAILWLSLSVLDREQREDASRMLASGGMQEVQVIETRIQSGLFYLESLASLIKQGTVFPLDAINVSSGRERFGFHTLSLVAGDGRIVSGDPLPVPVEQFPGFGKDEIAVVSVRDAPFLALMVPISQDFTGFETLVGTYDIPSIMETLAESSFAYKATRYLIDSSGKLLSSNRFPDGSDTFQTYLGAVVPEKIDSAERMLSSHQTETISFGSGPDLSYIDILSIFSTDWFLVRQVSFSDLSTLESLYTIKWLQIMLFMLSAVLAIVVYAVESRRKRSFHNMQREQLFHLPRHVSGGSFTCLIEDGMFFGEVSDDLARLFNCSIEEFRRRFSNRFDQMVLQEDRVWVVSELQNKFATDDSALVEYRVAISDGDIRWFSDWSRLVVDSGGKRWRHALVLDLTKQKVAQEAVRLSEERYRLAATNTGTAIFEWDILHETFYRSPNWKEVFGYTPHDNTAEHIFAMDRVHPEDRSMVAERFRECKEKGRNGEEEFRFLNAQGKHIWVRLAYTTMCDPQGLPMRVIGRMSDIDAKVRERKRLEYLARTDSLTGLLNRQEVENRIGSILRYADDNALRALCIIDIDRFKEINDKWGHLFGDRALAGIASAFTTLLDDSGAILGRIGGDELLVLLSPVSSRRELEITVERLMEAFSGIWADPSQTIPLTGSIGVAVHPTHGTDYAELFAKADAALYHVKGKEKNAVCIYEPGLAEEKNALFDNCT